MSRLLSLNAAHIRAVTPDGRLTAEFIRLLNDIVIDRRISCGPAQPKTISGGAISLNKSFSYFLVDTESAASSDNLDTISGGNEGDVIYIKAASSARTVVIRDGQGNILTNGGSSLSLTHADDLAMLFYDGTNWMADLWDISA